MEITNKKCKFCSADEVVDLGNGVGHCKKCCRLQTIMEFFGLQYYLKRYILSHE